LYREPCGRKWQRANVLVNIAWASVERGDLAKARANLEEAKAALAAPGATLAFALAYVDARVALAEKEPRRVREASDRLTRLAKATGLPEHAWRAADLRSEALAQLGDFDAALRASEEAEGILEDLSRSIPLGDGRDSFLGAREQSARRRVEL